MTFELRWRNECDFCLTVFRSKNCWLVLVSDKKNGWRLDRVLWCSYWNVLSKHLPARADVPCVCERGREICLCGVVRVVLVHNTHYTVFLFVWMRANEARGFSHLQKKHASHETCRCWILLAGWFMGHREKEAQTGCSTSRMLWNGHEIEHVFIFSCFTYFAWLAATHSVGEDWAKLCCLQIKSNFIMCVDWREAGGYTNQFWVSPYLPIGIRTKNPPKNGAETLRGGNSEAIWLANQAMHICMLIMWQEGGKEWKAPPMRQTERGRGRQDIEWDTREKGGRATEQMDKQTKESKGPIDEMGN